MISIDKDRRLVIQETLGFIQQLEQRAGSRVERTCAPNDVVHDFITTQV